MLLVGAQQVICPSNRTLLEGGVDALICYDLLPVPQQLSPRSGNSCLQQQASSIMRRLINSTFEMLQSAFGLSAAGGKSLCVCLHNDDIHALACCKPFAVSEQLRTLRTCLSRSSKLKLPSPRRVLMFQILSYTVVVIPFSSMRS